MHIIYLFILLLLFFWGGGGKQGALWSICAD